jgi:hypothetical protein
VRLVSLRCNELPARHVLPGEVVAIRALRRAGFVERESAV